MHIMLADLCFRNFILNILNSSDTESEVPNAEKCTGTKVTS